jgi:diphosphomevalonate decarboxylase
VLNFHEKITSKFQELSRYYFIVDKGEKQVSSTVGHDLMHNHPFAEQRFEQAHH